MTHSTVGRVAFVASLALSTAAAKAQAPSGAERRLLAENVLQADANGDAVRNRSEFETLIRLNAEDELGRAAMIVRSGRFDMAFRRIDANGDGLVIQSELQALAQHMQG